jgi:phage repressor protein C with HTH and peptisase S24 domain
MLSHGRIWEAIDRLAADNNLSASGLARKAGLDPTTFNRSKRVAADGRERWPSTESLSKILQATGTEIGDFLGILDHQHRGFGEPPSAGFRGIPLLGLAQAGAGGFFDDAGFPAGRGWDEVDFPGPGENVFALEVTGDSMMPLYRDGDTIIVARNTTVRRGDRVVVKTREGEVMAKVMQRKSGRQVELASLNPAHPVRTIATAEIEWMGRILWASQ